MSKFVIRKKVDLAFLGDDWKDCYINLTPLAVKEFEKIQKIAPKNTEDVAENVKAANAMVEILAEHFVDGQGYDGEKIVPIEKDDLTELPVDVLMACISNLAGKSDPKS